MSSYFPLLYHQSLSFHSSHCDNCHGSIPLIRMLSICLAGKNKRVGKQLASQKILQLLHPHVKNWGSLLRMYGRESTKMVKQVSVRNVHVAVREV